MENTVHVIQRLGGAELDELVDQGALDSDLRFQIKHNSHSKGVPIVVFLTQTVALKPNYNPSPINTHCAEVIAYTPNGPTLAEIIRDLPLTPQPPTLAEIIRDLPLTPQPPTLAEIIRDLPLIPQPKPWATWPLVKG